MIEKITAKQEVDADESTQVAKQGEEQKESQVADQKAAKADQDKAKEKSAMADAKAMTDAVNKQLAKIPQKIEEALDDAISAMQKALGYDPVIPKMTIVKPDGSSIEVPDFDPDKILKDIKKIIDPVLGALSPVESVVGKIPVVGDIISLLTKLGTQEFPGESEISMKEIRELVPTPPDFPPSIMQKAKRLLQLVQQFLMMLPIILIDVIFQMLCAIYDMFDQIVGILGVPPPIFPLNLVKQMPTLMPKVKTLMQQLPTQVDTLVVEKLKQKYQVAMALQIPKPNLGDAAADAKNAASNTASSGQVPSTGNDNKKDDADKKEAVQETPVAPSQPAPATSNIPETPSVKPIEPKPPVAPPDPMYGSIDLKFEFDGCTGKDKWSVDQQKSESIFSHIEKMAVDNRYVKKSNEAYEYNSLIQKKTMAQAKNVVTQHIVNNWMGIKNNIQYDGKNIQSFRTHSISMTPTEDANAIDGKRLDITVRLIQRFYRMKINVDEITEKEDFTPPGDFLKA